MAHGISWGRKRAPSENSGCPEYQIPVRNPTVTAAASRPASAVRPDASSLPASAPRAAGAVVAAVQAAFPQGEECAGAANARSAEAFATAEQAHSGWAPADCSAGLWADDSIPADLVPDGWAPADCSAALLADDSIPAGYSAQAGRCERRCFLDVRPADWPVAELRHDCLQGYKALLPLWPVRLHGP